MKRETDGASKSIAQNCATNGSNTPRRTHSVRRTAGQPASIVRVTDCLLTVRFGKAHGRPSDVAQMRRPGWHGFPLCMDSGAAQGWDFPQDGEGRSREYRNSTALCERGATNLAGSQSSHDSSRAQEPYSLDTRRSRRTFTYRNETRRLDARPADPSELVVSVVHVVPVRQQFAGCVVSDAADRGCLAQAADSSHPGVNRQGLERSGCLPLGCVGRDASRGDGGSGTGLSVPVASSSDLARPRGDTRRSRTTLGARPRIPQVQTHARDTSGDCVRLGSGSPVAGAFVRNDDAVIRRYDAGASGRAIGAADAEDDGLTCGRAE